MVRLATGLLAATLMCVSATAETPKPPQAYPEEALKLADTLVPELAASLRSCDKEQAKSVYKRSNDFMYKTWSWSANFPQLSPYRACFQMLSDIAATTRVVTDRYLGARPNMVAGVFDQNYDACRKLHDPSFQSQLKPSARMLWPARFGPEPGNRPCG